MKVVIVGGGTAGWLTALYLNKIAKDFDITLIESEEIGILGAGEGSVPVLVEFLEALNIDTKKFIKETNATFKLGIHFQNWKKDNSSYFHNFIINPNVTSLNSLFYHKTGNPIGVGLPDVNTDYALINWIANGKNINDFFISNKLAYNFKGPFLNNKGLLNAVNQYSYHFDASLFAMFLRKEAEKRGVKRIESVVNAFIGENKIEKLLLKNGQTINCDFIFDCTGFSRKIIGNHFKTKWISYKDKLKVDRAIPFFLPRDVKIKAYTEAIAMDYGWMWKIPLQNRYGCGYIFDSTYLDFEKAKKEVENFVGQQITVNRQIKFEAGRFEKFWVGNCVSIGLSSGFTEPIEATAIWTIIQQLSNITKYALLDVNQSYIDEYNNMIGEFNDSIVDFLQFHYFTDKDNTPFWKNYINSSNLSDKIKQKLKMWKLRTPNSFDKQNGLEVFNTLSWMLVGLGINDNLIPIDIIKRENLIYNLDNDMKVWMDNYKNNIDIAMSQSINHDLLLKSIIENADK